MFVTVGICAYNEGANIGPLLNNVLYKQNLSEEYEVIVICSGCTDNTVAIARQIEKKDSRVKIFEEKERLGKASAINRILKNAKGENILLISADTMPHKECFNQLISKLYRTNVGLVCARPKPVNNSHSLTDKLVQILWGLHDQLFIQLDKDGQAKHASELYLIRKGITNEIPMGVVNDDAYIALTTIKKGWSIYYEPKSCVSICGPQTICDYIRQRRRVIYGHHQVKKLTRESPQYFTPILKINQERKNELFLTLIKKYDFLSIFTFFWIEAVLNILVMADFMIGKTYTTWNIAKTTKRAMI